MLTHLSITNIVLINHSEIDFCRGLCVLTGETGAGKSILLDALGLVLGERAESGLVRHGEEKGTVVAEFDISKNSRAQQLLASLELDIEDGLILRRSVGSDGKSRSFANDRPVSVTALKQLGETLVEIYGQHDQRALMDAAQHRLLLDAFGGYDKDHGAMKSAWQHLNEKQKALAALYEQAKAAKREEEYLRHMALELQKLAPEVGEEEALSEQRTTMMQSEKLFDVLNDAISELNDGKGVVATLGSVQRLLLRSPLTSGAAFAPVVDGLERALTEAMQASELLEEIGRDATFRPEKLEEVEERLFALKAAGRKYNLPVDELPQLAKEVREKLSLIDANEVNTAALEKDVMEAKKAYREKGLILRAAREKAAKVLEKKVLEELEPLKMGSTRFRASVVALEESGWGGNGMESITFEAATNVGKKSTDIPFAPLNKIASGGELSRFMLAFKVALSGVRSTPTLIFDEIDTGTGGAVADAIGQRLGRLGDTAQVLVVTHLPQVAARGVEHLRVSKEEQNGVVKTTVDALSKAARKEELARMLAGSTVTPEARKAAQKLLESAA